MICFEATQQSWYFMRFLLYFTLCIIFSIYGLGCNTEQTAPLSSQNPIIQKEPIVLEETDMEQGQGMPTQQHAHTWPWVLGGVGAVVSVSALAYGIWNRKAIGFLASEDARPLWSLQESDDDSSDEEAASDLKKNFQRLRTNWKHRHPLLGLYTDQKQHFQDSLEEYSYSHQKMIAWAYFHSNCPDVYAIIKESYLLNDKVLQLFQNTQNGHLSPFALQYCKKHPQQFADILYENAVLTYIESLSNLHVVETNHIYEVKWGEDADEKTSFELDLSKALKNSKGEDEPFHWNTHLWNLWTEKELTIDDNTHRFTYILSTFNDMTGTNSVLIRITMAWLFQDPSRITEKAFRVNKNRKVVRADPTKGDNVSLKRLALNGQQEAKLILFLFNTLNQLVYAPKITNH